MSLDRRRVTLTMILDLVTTMVIGASPQASNLERNKSLNRENW